MKILIVEDNRVYREMMRSTLEEGFSGMCIEEAGDATEALRKISEQLPDLIIMDIGLPGENGLSLMKKVKTQNPDIKIVILTNYDYPAYRTAALKSGARMFLSKASATPVDVQRMVRTVLQEKDRAGGK